MFIPVILGTAREGRESEKVARYLLAEVKAAGIETEMLDVRDYRIVATDKTGEPAQAKALSPKIERADGIIIVTPEYNHGYPGELKMMLDLLYTQWQKKPVGFAGVSSGGLGGARVVEQMREVIAELHMVDVREALYFSNVQDLFDGKGAIKDASLYRDRVKNFLDELVCSESGPPGEREEREHCDDVHAGGVGAVHRALRQRQT